MRTLGRPIDILIVEDDPGDELMTIEALEENRVGNTLHVVRDGQEALDFLYRTGDHTDAPRPGLVLLDLNLPKYSGRQILERIKSDQDLCDIPVVVLTTSSSEDDIVSSYRSHANAFVTKPVEIDQFFQVVRSMEQFWLEVVKLARP